MGQGQISCDNLIRHPQNMYSESKIMFLALIVFQIMDEYEFDLEKVGRGQNSQWYFDLQYS